jgi:glycosyltransferase involved in cell wall biosynthesis
MSNGDAPAERDDVPAASSGERTRPMVSVVIPAFNAARYVRASITSALGQQGVDLECIVVDDGSCDGTAEVIASIDDDRLRCLQKENRGTASDARNVGMAAARGDYIAFLDADDLWLPGKLRRQMELFASRPDLVLVSCAYAIVAEDLSVRTVIEPTGDGPRQIERWLLLEGNGIAPSSTAVIRRSAIERTAGFRLDLAVGEDLEFVERIASLGAVAFVPECLALYRTHDAQRHADLEEFERGMTWVLADRYGAGGSIDRARWRRGTANLHTRLLAYRLAEHQDGPPLAHLRHAAVNGPSRIIALPLEALVRRARRRWSRCSAGRRRSG